MIYILESRGDVESIYGLDDVIDLSKKNVEFEDLISKEFSSRIGLLNPPEYIISRFLEINYPLVYIGNMERIHPSYNFISLPAEFFRRDAKKVALELLGKIVMRRTGNTILMGKILETEAYYGPNDPASRAYKGKKDYNRGMWLSGGHVFIYMVHANWMFNITTDGDEPQAILIRAVEPLMGIEFMYRRRKRKLRELCNGPGKWTKAFAINKEMNEKPLGSDISVLDSPWHYFDVKRSHRIGVRHDLEEPLRFFINSKFTSNNKIF